jgi:exodeoxyribonuclease-3
MGSLLLLLQWLAEARPDIVCLQELKAREERFPEAAIRMAGYGEIWHGQKSWNGVAILARGGRPVETGRSLAGDPDDTHSRYIEADINGLLIGCLTFQTATRRRAALRLQASLDRTPLHACRGAILLFEL